MIFSQIWIRSESTSGSKRWFRVRISRLYTTFMMHAAGVWWQEVGAAPMLGVECDQTSCVGTRVRHVCHHVTSTRCRGRVAAVACTVPCTVLYRVLYCTVYCVLYCGQGDVTALPRIARQCHVATPRSPPRCQPQWPRWSSLLARLVSMLELCIMYTTI